MPAKVQGKLAPAQILAGGFAVTILIGTLLLMLPMAAREGRLPFIDALFTATSAVCVTGLVVRNDPGHQGGGRNQCIPRCG